MAWEHYYINGNFNENKDRCFLYDSKIPPHGGIREEWTTVGLKHGTSKILFEEYLKVDDDPDGVWEAFGMKAETVYTFTINAKEAIPENLFVYTLYKDGSLCVGFDIDTKKAVAILAFAEPYEIDSYKFASVAENAKKVFRISGAVEQLIKDELLGGSDDVICLAYFMM